MVPAIEVIVGTYNEYLLGYQLVQRQDKDGEQHILLKATFADKSHDGSIKSLAVHKHWMATGGIDDRIFVYDMRLRKQAHVLSLHRGIVNTLVFTSDCTHLISGGIDGRMVATRLANWTTEGDWPKPHNGKAITHIACHPSSRLCLSLGADQVLNTWNLLKGRIAYRTNLKSKRSLGLSPDCLTWSTEGNYFSMCGPRTFEIWSIEKASVVRQFNMPSKPICVAWLDENNCLSGLENGHIAWMCLDDEEDADPQLLEAHENRVKGIAYMHDTLVTISSLGEIKVWSCDIANKKLSVIASTNIDCRPTCLSLLDASQFGHGEEITRPSAKQQKAAKLAARIEALESERSRSYVAIEYDEQSENNILDKSESESEAEKESEANNGSKPSSESEPFSESDPSSNSDYSEEEVLPARLRRATKKKNRAVLKSANSAGHTGNAPKRRNGMPHRADLKRAKNK